MRLRILNHLSAFAVLCAIPLAAHATTDEGGAGASSAYEVESSSPASTVTTEEELSGDSGGAGTTSGSMDGGAGTTEASPSPTVPGDASSTDTGASADPALSEGQTQSEQGGAGATSGSTGIESGSSMDTPTPGTPTGDAIDAETGAVSEDPATSESQNQSDLGGAGATSGSSVSADQVTGVVDSVDTTRRRLTVRDDQGNLVSYDLSAGATVKVGDRDSALSALSNGDAVTITLSEDDPTSATEVRVDAGQ